MPIVSIVVPCYNVANFVEETLQSLLAQTFQDLEIIAINDGSTDITPKILDRYALLYPLKLRVVHQVNQGQSKALNKGWSLATGNLLGYLSADDLIDPGSIEKMSRQLELDASIDILYPDYRLIDSYSRLIKEVKTSDFILNDLVVRMLCQPGPGVLFRKIVFTELKGWNEDIRQIPDYDFWLRASRKFKFKRFRQSSASFRIHEDSQSFQSPNISKSNEPIEVMKEFIKSGFHNLLEGRQDEALSQAYILSVRLHARAWRLSHAIKHWFHAIRLSPSHALSGYSFKLILHGLLDRTRFYIKQKMTASK